MKILQASSYFYPHIGGVETHVLELSQNLLDMGHDVLVVCAQAPKSPPFQALDGLSVFRLPALDLPYIPYTWFLRRRLSPFKADVIHSHYPPPFMSYGAIKGLPQLPHVLTYHCDLELPDKIASLKIPNIAKKGIKHINMKLYLSSIMNSVQRIIATAESYARTSQVLRDYPYTVIPNGIGLEAFDNSASEVCGERETKKVLFVGRLSAVKGIDYLIEAAKLVLAQQHDATFVIVGRGEDEERLKALAKGLGDRIKFCGHISRQALLRLYRTSTVLVLPSFTRLEAFGVVLLEAMASETPVIASRIPGVLDVVGDGGMLVQPRDPLQLASAILEVLDDPKTARAMGRDGRRRVERHYDWKIVSREIVNVYKAAIDAPTVS
ncbi:MAG: glycosyltransferase family 4 protein [Euryarchaeota archaeon]|nr:glycosyltransferase family 4 protein [Euryarchaeota archaeon]